MSGLRGDGATAMNPPDDGGAMEAEDASAAPPGRLDRRTLLRFAVVAVLALAAALALDRAAYAWLYNPRVYDHDLGRMLRSLGFLPTWILAAAALALQDGGWHGRPWPRAYGRALFLFASPTVAGIAGAVLQLLIRRERPWAHAGGYVFRPFTDRPFYGGGLAMPSSHAVVAFGAAFALARLFPRAAPVWYLLAAGCAYTRVAARAHFLSDVVLAAIVAWLVVALLWRWFGRRAARAEERPTFPA